MYTKYYKNYLSLTINSITRVIHLRDVKFKCLKGLIVRMLLLLFGGTDGG